MKNRKKQHIVSKAPIGDLRVNSSNKESPFLRFGGRFIYYTWVQEFRNIIKDPGVMVLLILAPLAYPILYACIYKNETLHEVPIAVVDNSGSALSRQYIRSIDATREVHVAANCLSLTEAKHLYQQRKVHGVIVIPSDFQNNIGKQKQAHVSAFTDMSSFMYYQALATATSFVGKDMGLKIQLQRLQEQGFTERQAHIAAEPFTYSNNPLYNPTAGYASFLLPAALILILHQTLLMGIGMLSGTAYEKYKKVTLLRINGIRQSVFSSLLGKTLCYLLMYTEMVFYVVCIIPYLFNLPIQGNPVSILLFMLPFLLATIFFGLTLAVFFHSRENSMLLILFTTIPLLFISGISWPTTAIPEFWKIVGWFLPSTHGINGYVRLNTMGANLSQIQYEYLSLWILSGFYFLLAYFLRIWQIKREKKATMNTI